MKTLTRVVLPILAVAGLVFGITWIANYTPNDPNKKGEQEKGGIKGDALKFPFVTAQAKSNEWTRYWDSDYEVGTKGHFDFWFRNISDQPVRLASKGVSCQCAGADVGIIPQEAMANYLRQSAAGHFPGMPGGPILDALNAVHLRDRIEWKQVVTGMELGEVTIPSAPASPDESLRGRHLNPENPQLAIVRLKWEAKPREGPEKDVSVSVKGYFVSQLPGANAAQLELEAYYFVVQPLNVYIPGGSPNEIRLEKMYARSSVTREFICWSKTRAEMDLKLELATPGAYKDCVALTEPKRLTESEIADLEKKLPESSVRIQSAYRVFLTVYEQREIERNGKKTVRQLDLGPIIFQLKISPVQTTANPVSLLVHGVVRGDVRIIGANSESTEGVDFGTSFSSDESKTQEVTIVSERDGLDLELLRDERVPDYLDVVLVPDGESNGRKQWKLRVTIPQKSLFGDLPSHSLIILQTKDSPPRRVRIPVRAKTLN